MQNYANYLAASNDLAEGKFLMEFLSEPELNDSQLLRTPNLGSGLGHGKLQGATLALVACGDHSTHAI